MTATHLEILCEELSMEVFLAAVLPRIVGNDVTFRLHTHQGKHDLLRKLGSRLQGYAQWLPAEARVVVLVDRDDDDCRRLKATLEAAAQNAGLRTPTAHSGCWQAVSRIAVEELEAWFFGEWRSVTQAFRRVPEGAINKAAYRQCDAIAGGTWEAFERILQQHGYHRTGLRKVEAAQCVAAHFDPDLCRSHSFAALCDVLRRCTSPPPAQGGLT